MPGAPPSAAIHVWIKAEFDGVKLMFDEYPRDTLHQTYLSQRQQKLESSLSLTVLP